MPTRLHATLSASGSPSEVKARIDDQIKGTAAVDQAAALGAIRTFIEKSIADVTEDETVAVSAVVTVNVAPIPAIVHAKVQAAVEKQTVAETTVASLRAELEKAKAALEAATAPPAAPVVAAAPVATPTPTIACPGGCGQQVISERGISKNPDGTVHTCPPKG
jgi:hypothetical protein